MCIDPDDSCCKLPPAAFRYRLPPVDDKYALACEFICRSPIAANLMDAELIKPISDFALIIVDAPEDIVTFPDVPTIDALVFA